MAFLMPPPCLESQGCHLSPSVYLLPYSSGSCWSFCLLLVSAFGPVSCLLSRNFLKLFSRDSFFLVRPYFFRFKIEDPRVSVCVCVCVCVCVVSLACDAWETVCVHVCSCMVNLYCKRPQALLRGGSINVHYYYYYYYYCGVF